MNKAVIVSLWFFSLAVWAAAGPIADNPAFKLLDGSWSGTGEMFDQAGNRTVVTETWDGAFTEEGNFLITGVRKFDMTEHDFAWEFYSNDDLIEGIMKMSQPEIERRFEVLLDEEEREFKLVVPLGGGSVLHINNVISKNGKEIEGKFRIENEAGVEVGSGNVVHRKQ